MVFSDMSVALTPFTAVLSDAVSNDQTIDCVNGFGIKVGANYTGIGVNNATTQVVTGITYGGNTFETTSNQTLQDKTILTFTGCSQEAVIKAKIKVTKIPKDNLILTLDLDSLLTSNPT